MSRDYFTLNKPRKLIDTRTEFKICRRFKSPKNLHILDILSMHDILTDRATTRDGDASRNVEREWRELEPSAEQIS